MTTFAEIFSIEFLTKSVENFTQAAILPGLKRFGYYTNRVDLPGDSAKWNEVNYSRNIAEGFKAPNAPAKSVELLTEFPRTSMVLNAALYKTLHGDLLAKISKLDNATERGDADKIQREQVDLVAALHRIYEYACWQALMNGKITIDQSDIKLTVDYNIPADHKVKTAISWADPEADIIGDLATFRQKIAADSGDVATNIVINGITRNYILKNKAINEMMRDVSDVRRDILVDDNIMRLKGFNFEIRDEMYTASGVAKYYVPTGKALIDTPNNGVYEFQTGVAAVPNINRQSIDFVSGLFSYVDVTKNPVALQMFVGQNGLPIVKKPNNIIIADVS